MVSATFVLIYFTLFVIISITEGILIKKRLEDLDHRFQNLIMQVGLLDLKLKGKDNVKLRLVEEE